MNTNRVVIRPHRVINQCEKYFTQGKPSLWVRCLFLFFFFFLLSPLFPQEHYLLKNQIEAIFNTGDYSLFKSISLERISANFDPPFELKGYIYIDKFIAEYTQRFTQFEAQGIEWSSLQMDGRYAVQSLNLILRNRRSEKVVYYKFILFLVKNKQEWKIYYLRGSNL